MNRAPSVLLFSLIAFMATMANAAPRPLPDNLTAAIMLKLAEFEEGRRGEALRVHVIGNTRVAKILEKRFEAEVLSGRGRVTVSGALPQEEVDIVFVQGGFDIDLLRAFSRANHAMTVTNDPAKLEEGLSVAIYDDEGMPGVMLNLEASREEDLSWRAEVLEIATVLNK